MPAITTQFPPAIWLTARPLGKLCSSPFSSRRRADLRYYVLAELRLSPTPNQSFRIAPIRPWAQCVQLLAVGLSGQALPWADYAFHQPSSQPSPLLRATVNANLILGVFANIELTHH